jgi:hypothetical protein
MDTADFELGEIIRKDFLSLEPNPNWWFDKYSVATYYRNKSRAASVFIDLHNKHVN